MAYDVVLGCFRKQRSQFCNGRLAGSVFKRFGAASLALLVFAACDGLTGTGNGYGVPPARPGVASWFEDLMVEVPGARVNAGGGNLHVERDDMNVDTRLGNWSVGAVWNSASGEWLWNFDTSLKPTPRGHALRFVDPSGFGRLVNKVAIGEPVGGTHWTRHDTDAMRTHGGLVYRFDSAGALASVNWGSAEYPRLEFVRSGSRLQTIDQCRSVGDCHTLFTMTYDNQGRVISIVDLAGRSSLYTYELGSHRVATARDPLDVANGWPGTRYQYDHDYRLTSITNSHEERVEYEYIGVTKSVFKVKQIGDGNPLWAFWYEGLEGYWRAVTTVVDPIGALTSYRYDYHLRLFRKTNGNNEQWRWRWAGDSFARVSAKSPAGVERTFDAVSDDVMTETLPGGNVITTTYAPWPAENRHNPRRRPVLSIVDSLGAIETRTYSATGELESVANGAGETTTYTYDLDGDLVVTDPAGVVTTYGNRGDHGHHLTETQGGKTVNHTYDAIGNLLSSDGLLEEPRQLAHDSLGQGGIVGRFYDADRNVSGLILDDGGLGAPGVLSSLSVTWRADHQRTRIARPYGGDSEFLYDALGRKRELRTLVDGVWKSTVYERDARGAVTATLKPNGMATRYTYRSAGDVASITHERDWSDPLEVDSYADLVYANGQLVEIRDGAHGMSPEVYHYDAGGRVDQVDYPNGESMLIGYDLRGRVNLRHYVRPDTTVLRTFDYVHDLADRIVGVDEDGASVLSVTIVGGRAVFEQHGNGVSVARGFDPVTGAMTGLTATNAAQQIVASMSVTYSTCGISLPASPCRIEQTDSLIGVVHSSHAEYQVEDQGSERLIADSYGILQPADGFYQYDELSNVLQSAAGDFVYNPERNRLLRIEDQGATLVDYLYDDAGYVVSRNGVPVVWNGMGRVLSAGTDLSMQWDALGRRVSLVSAGDETHWRYGDALTQDDVGANQTIDLGWMVSRIDAGTHEYRVNDFRGNAKLVFDDAGDVSAHHDYSGYGLEASAGAGGGAIGFAQGVHVGEFVILGQRLYDPVAGRFASQDPIFQLVNQFAYTLGNPVRFWDPGGDQSWKVKSFSVSAGFAGIVPVLTVTVTWEVTGDPGSGSSVGGAVASGSSSGSGGAGGSGSGGGGAGGGGTNPGGGSIDAPSCGLGFEAAPFVLAAFASRHRRGQRTRG